MNKFKNKTMRWVLERSLEYFSPQIRRNEMIEGKIVSDPHTDSKLYWNYRANRSVFKAEFNGMELHLLNDACLRVRALLEIQRRSRYDQ